MLVGSAAFAALLEGDPQLASAAALGARVVTLAAAGWVTIVWPDTLEAGTPVALDLPRHSSSGGAGGPTTLPATSAGGGAAGDVVRRAARSSGDYAVPAFALAVVAIVGALAAWRRMAGR